MPIKEMTTKQKISQDLDRQTAQLFQTLPMNTDNDWQTEIIYDWSSVFIG